MMASITPLGERARGNRWWRTAAALAAGCLLGGWVLGAAAGAAGWAMSMVTAPAPGAAAVAAAVAVAAGLLELVAWQVPTRRRQVDEAWLARYRGWVYGLGFGLQLGTGLATTVTTVAVYAAACLAFLLGHTGEVAAAQAVGAVFGLARAVPVLGGARLHDPQQLRRRVARMTAAATTSRVATGSSLLLLGAWAAVGV